MYYSFIHPNLIDGMDYWGHASETLIRNLCVTKAFRIILKRAPNSRVPHQSDLILLEKYANPKLFSNFVLSSARRNEVFSLKKQKPDFHSKNHWRPINIRSEKAMRSCFTVLSIYLAICLGPSDLSFVAFKWLLAARLWGVGVRLMVAWCSPFQICGSFSEHE